MTLSSVQLLGTESHPKSYGTGPRKRLLTGGCQYSMTLRPGVGFSSFLLRLSTVGRA
jgi:hypothetical protein